MRVQYFRIRLVVGKNVCGGGAGLMYAPFKARLECLYCALWQGDALPSGQPVHDVSMVAIWTKLMEQSKYGPKYCL